MNKPNKDVRYYEILELVKILFFLFAIIIILIVILAGITKLVLLPYQEICRDLGYDQITDYDNLPPKNIECDGQILKICYGKDKWGVEDHNKPQVCGW